MKSTRVRLYAELKLRHESGGALLAETQVPFELEFAPVNHPVPFRCLYGPVTGGWRPTKLLAAATLLDAILSHEDQ